MNAAMLQASDSLLLVNASHPYPHAIEQASMVRVGPEGVWMQRHAAALLEQLMEQIQGWRQIVAVSGWRSHVEQQAIWEQSLRENGEAYTRQYVAAPGCSEHHTGLAIDLGLRKAQMDPICPDFPYHGICRIFRQKAAQYGFVQRYPFGKTHLTGIAEEPWHFRYVGIPHAQIMENRGLTLEEYLLLLRQHPLGHVPLVYSTGAFHFAISYLPTEQILPARYRSGCLCSSDNTGGIILTQWEVKTDAYSPVAH